jgi:hypothetical protein
VSKIVLERQYLQNGILVYAVDWTCLLVVSSILSIPPLKVHEGGAWHSSLQVGVPWQPVLDAVVLSFSSIVKVTRESDDLSLVCQRLSAK